MRFVIFPNNIRFLQKMRFNAAFTINSPIAVSLKTFLHNSYGDLKKLNSYYINPQRSSQKFNRELRLRLRG